MKAAQVDICLTNFVYDPYTENKRDLLQHVVVDNVAAAAEAAAG